MHIPVLEPQISAAGNRDVSKTFKLAIILFLGSVTRALSPEASNATQEIYFSRSLLITEGTFEKFLVPSWPSYIYAGFESLVHDS